MVGTANFGPRVDHYLYVYVQKPEDRLSKAATLVLVRDSRLFNAFKIYREPRGMHDLQSNLIH